MSQSFNGVACGFGAYFLWGVLPLFWKCLGGLPADEIICHRAIWSFFLVTGLIGFRYGFRSIELKNISLKTWIFIISGAVCIGLNWLINVSAVNSGKVIECSLGYYMNPIFSLFLGVFFLGERLRRLQIFAVFLAGAGVALLVLLFGETPWTAISLTVTFGFYGLFKKLVKINAMIRLWFEICFLSLAVLPYFVYLECSDTCHFLYHDVKSQIFLAATGLATVLPLMCFASALDKVRLSTIGILQFVAPTLQFLMGVFVFNEKITPGFLIGFMFIWAGIGAYALDGLQNMSGIGLRKVSDPVTRT